jgi:hypothetical protein
MTHNFDIPLCNPLILKKDHHDHLSHSCFTSRHRASDLETGQTLEPDHVDLQFPIVVAACVFCAPLFQLLTWM